MTVTIGRQLGTTNRAEDLIPGRPAALYADADAVVAVAQELLDAAARLGQLDLTSWRGNAADAFADAIRALRAELTTAAHCHAVAAAALSDHGAVLSWAQSQARAAIGLYAAGAACVDGAPLLGSGLNPAQVRAVEVLDDARAAVHRSAAVAAGSLDEAVRRAPRRDGFWNDAGQQWSHFWHGAWEPVAGIGVLAWQGNTVRMVIDPQGWWDDRSALLAGLWASVQDPKQLGKDLLDWDTWANDPARAAGHLVPDAALALLTGGAGTAATRGASAATKIAEEAAEEGAVVAAKSAAKDAAEQAAEQGPKRYGDEEIGRTTPGDGPVIFNARADLTPEEITQLTDYVRVANSARLDGELSDIGRVSTKGELREAASEAAQEERIRASDAGTPYGDMQAGHGPDTTWTGDPEPREWLAQTQRVNGSLGGQAGRYPVGFVPSVFQLRLRDGTTWPTITGEVP